MARCLASSRCNLGSGSSHLSLSLPRKHFGHPYNASQQNPAQSRTQFLCSGLPLFIYVRPEIRSSISFITAAAIASKSLGSNIRDVAFVIALLTSSFVGLLPGIHRFVISHPHELAHERPLRFLPGAKILACRPVHRHSAERALLRTSISSYFLLHCATGRPFVAQTVCAFDPHDEAKSQALCQTLQDPDGRVSASAFDCRNDRLSHGGFRCQLALSKPA